METYTVTVDNEKNVCFYKPGTDILHRLDGPAIEEFCGDKEWYVDGKLHRTDGPAVVYSTGRKEWFVEGKLHRIDGPAVERADGGKVWYVNGECHRLDGPAVEYANGTKCWYIEGNRLTEEKFKEKTSPTPSCDGKVVEIDGKKYRLTSI